MLYQFGQYIVDKEHHNLYCNGKVISNNEKTIRLLAQLCEGYPEVLDKEVLIKNIWSNQVVSDWSLSKLISEARQLLGDSGKEQDLIKTVRGQGFRLNTKVKILVQPQPTAHSELTLPSPGNKFLISGLISILLVIVGYYFLNNKNDLADSLEQPIRVAVLPLINNTSDPVNEWIKYGIMSMITQQLSSYQSIQTIPIATIINTSSEINYGNEDSTLFENICGKIGCSHLVIIKHKNGKKNNPILTYQILKSGYYSPISDFSRTDIIDTADMLLDHLASDLLPHDKDHYSLADTYSNDNKANRDYGIGVDELLNGDLSSAKIYLDLALARQPDFLWASAYLAELSYRQGNLSDSLAIIEKLKKQELSANQSYFLQHLFSNILYAQGKLEESIQTSIALKKNSLVIKNPILMGNELLNIGSGLQSLGKMKQAITYLQQAQAAYKQAGYGSGEGKSLYNIANVYLTTLRKDKAIIYYKRAREVFIRYKMPGYALMAKQQIATTNLSLGKIQNAENELLLVIQGYKKIGDLEGELTANSDLINVSFAKNNFQEAKERAEKLLKRLKSTEFSYLTHHSHSYLVKIYLRLGELENAETHFNQLSGEWEDIRPSFVFMAAHIEQKKGHIKKALDMAQHLKSLLHDKWTEEHQAVLKQFEISHNKKQITPIIY